MTAAPRLPRSLGTGLFVLGAVVWLVLLRPTSLGGPASYVVIAGSSMEPGIVTGDLVVAVRQDAYEAGDVVAFRVGDAIVVHRIVGGSAGEGYVTQGDNRAVPDVWRPRPAEVLGVSWLHVPAVGVVAAWLRQPVVLGALAGAITVLVVLTSDGVVGRRRQGGVGA